MHLEADDLAAVEVEDQVKIEPASLNLRRQERQVPTPNLAGSGGDMRGRRTRCPWRLSASPAVHLAMRAQHATEAGFTGDVDPLVGQRWHDPGRRCLGKTWFVGKRDDRGPFSLAQGVGRHRTLSGRTPIRLRQAIAGLPSPQRAGVDAGQSASRSEPRSIRASLFDVAHQGLAVFQAGHASSPWWKTAESS
jgi:hypothetical protein